MTANIGAPSPVAWDVCWKLATSFRPNEAQAAIEAEIDREQAVFDAVAAERDAELDLLRLSMTLAHNRGDLTQGMGFWKNTPLTTPLMEHFAERGRFARPFASINTPGFPPKATGIIRFAR